MHIFAHRSAMYPFETSGEDDWMGTYFFTGGLMPSTETLLWFQGDLEHRGAVAGGRHSLSSARPRTGSRIGRASRGGHGGLRETYGAANAAIWYQRWRMFYMACAELFGYAGGQEWLVAHYRFARRP